MHKERENKYPQWNGKHSTLFHLCRVSLQVRSKRILTGLLGQVLVWFVLVLRVNKLLQSPGLSPGPFNNTINSYYPDKIETYF